jgi:hypothetical protein
MRGGSGAWAAGDIGGWPLLTLVLRGAAATWLFFEVTALADEGVVPSAPWVVAQGVVLFPSAVVGLLVRLGWVRPAWLATRVLVPWEAFVDPASVAILNGGRALRHARVQRPAAVSFLRTRLGLMPPVRSGLPLLAAATVADALGVASSARLLFAAAASLPRWWGRRRPRAAARRWLAADAAERGDVDALVALAGASADGGLAYAAVLGQVRAGRTAATPGRLRYEAIASPGAWTLAPLGWNLCSADPQLPARPASSGEPLTDALALHAWSMSVHPGALEPDDLVALSSAWAAAVASEDLLARIGRRIASLQAKISPEAARAAIVGEVLGDLVRLVDALPRPLEITLPPGSPLDAARQAVVEQRIALFQTAAEEFRGAERQAFQRFAAWEQWMTVREAWERLGWVATTDERRSALQDAWGVLCNRGAQLANVHREIALAHEIFRFLHAECTMWGVVTEGDLLERNTAITR